MKKKKDNVWTSKDKAKFRKTKEWIDFRNKMIGEKKCCEVCGNNLRLQCHHIYLNDAPEEYSNLTPERFAILCHSCHNYFHKLSRTLHRKKNPPVPRDDIRELCDSLIKTPEMLETSL
jgi:hypothetical protein